MDGENKSTVIGEEDLRRYYVTKARLTIAKGTIGWSDNMYLKALRKHTKRVIRTLDIVMNMMSEQNGNFYEVILAYMLSGKISREDYESLCDAWCKMSYFRYEAKRRNKFFNRLLQGYHRDFTNLSSLLNIIEDDRMVETEERRKEAN